MAAIKPLFNPFLHLFPPPLSGRSRKSIQLGRLLSQEVARAYNWYRISALSVAGAYNWYRISALRGRVNPAASLELRMESNVFMFSGSKA
ncbi:hypothetical protein L1987_63770 [Smallanthus sonchifolius]|uniref:Uncharacterized protein n=1 Tax=Smallanthus sonchifolius TaxID=185202 RepID=A0ACB9CE64_9ASTR|nr:hypothetical protein L1987_63770 [Smallanthus sonchifolius]